MRLLTGICSLISVLVFGGAPSAMESGAAEPTLLYPIVRNERIGLIDPGGKQVVAPRYQSLAGYGIESWPRFPRVDDIVRQWAGWEPVEVGDPPGCLICSVGGQWGCLSGDGSVATGPEP